jgi:hypothetical protein
MQPVESRVAFVVRNVVTQAMRDAGCASLMLQGDPSPQSELIERWCGTSFADAAPGLRVSPANKTELLLGGVEQRCDVTPLGDLYASEVAQFAGGFVIGKRASELVEVAGGIEMLDGCLRKLLDERRNPDAAFAAMPHLRGRVLQCLEQSRFRRGGAGIVPKLGARTIGIDLFI